MEPTVDNAIDVLRKEAEAHEKEHGGGFCSDTRCGLVVFVMLNLGLSLGDLGLIAEGLAEQWDDDDPEPQPDDQWPNTIQSD